MRPPPYAGPRWRTSPTNGGISKFQIGEPVAALRAYTFEPECTYMTPSTTMGVCWKTLLRLASTLDLAASSGRPNAPAIASGLNDHFRTTVATLLAVVSVTGEERVLARAG